MRTATTISENRDGTETLIFGRKVSLQKQREEFNRLRVLHPRVHADYSAVVYQEDDGRPERIEFARPEGATEQKSMKSRFKNALSAMVLFAALALNANAANWNDAFGIGGGSYGSPLFSGSGQTLAVIGSVRSNSLYYIPSIDGPGAPLIETIFTKNDLVAGALDFWRATNTLSVASNGAAGDTTVWLVASNAVGGFYPTLATNDVLVYKGSGEAYQLVVLSGNATSSQGVVTSNSLGQVQIKFFNGLTNAPAVGDTIYKMARIQQFAPLGFAITNVFAYQSTNSASQANQWYPLTPFVGGPPIRFSGNKTFPIAVTLTFSNTAGLFLNGSYVRNP